MLHVEVFCSQIIADTQTLFRVATFPTSDNVLGLHGRRDTSKGRINRYGSLATSMTLGPLVREHRGSGKSYLFG